MRFLYNILHIKKYGGRYSSRKKEVAMEVQMWEEREIRLGGRRGARRPKRNKIIDINEDYCNN